MSELASLQRRLLATGLSSLRSGGVLAYVTCSPHIAETIDVVEEVLLHIDDVQVLDAREFLPNVPDLGRGRTCSCGLTCTAPMPCTSP